MRIPADLPRNPFRVGDPSSLVRVAALFSGGKDSTYSAYLASQRGWQVTHLISIRPEDPASMLFHVPNLHLTPLLAEAMGLPLLEERAGVGEDEELEGLRRAIRRVDVDGIVVGAVASDYQHRRVNRVGHELGVRVFAPLWRHDPRRLVREYLRAGLRIAFSAVSAEGFDASWLGRIWDDRVVEDLLRLHDRHRVHPCGEGGEFETLVLDAPFFSRAIDVVHAEPHWSGTSGVWQIREARLVPKTAERAVTGA